MLSYLIKEIEKADKNQNVEIIARSEKDMTIIDNLELVKHLFNDSYEFDILIDVKENLLSISIYEKGAEFDLTVEAKKIDAPVLISDLICLNLNKNFKYWITIL